MTHTEALEQKLREQSRIVNKLTAELNNLRVVCQQKYDELLKADQAARATANQLAAECGYNPSIYAVQTHVT